MARIQASLASLPISAQELLYAVKAESIDPLLKQPFSKEARKLVIALYFPRLALQSSSAFASCDNKQ